MKKLVYILNQYSNKEGSHFFHVLNLLEELAFNDVIITLVVEKATDKPRIYIPNVKVIIQKKSGIGRFIELFSILKKLNKAGYKKIFIRISQNGALPAILASKLYGGDVFYWQSGKGHVLDKEKSFVLKHYLKSKLPFDIVKNHVDYFVTGPESMLDYYEKVVGVKKEKLMCLYNDIDTHRFSIISDKRRTIYKKDLDIFHNKKIILFVHRLSPIRKSLFYVPYVLEGILKQRDDYICYIIGGGSEQEELIALINEKKLEKKVLVLGEIPNRVIHKFYQIADIFINPTYTEGFPRVLLEAMASGLPVVTTNAGGIADIVGEIQSKFMVDIEDRDGFSSRLKELIENEEVQKKIAIENEHHVTKFSTENVAKMYIDKIFKNE